MAQIVKLRRSSLQGNKPSTAQLELGELAINTYDGKLYFEKSGSAGESIEEIFTTNIQTSGSLILSGESHYITGSLSLSGSLKLPTIVRDYTNSTGSAGQILHSTLNGVLWADQATGSVSIEGRSVVQQFSSSLTWSFVHNLGEQFPTLEVYDSNNQVIIPSTITATNANTLTITFAVPVAGRATATLGGGLPTISGSFENYILTAVSGSPAWVNPNTITVATASYALTASYAENIIVSGTISNVDAIDFDTTANMASAVGRLKWNEADGTLDLGMGGGNAVLQLGQELYYPPIVNKSGVQLIEGTLVMVDPSQPAQGNRLRVIKAVTDGTYPSSLIVGVLTETLNNNATGLATWFGYVRSLSLASLKPAGETWIEGTILYADPTRPGGLTSIQPSAPNHRSTIAAITSISGNNFTIMVRPSLGLHLDDIHDVRITSGSNGDLLIRNGSGVFANSKNFTGSYTLTGSINGGSFTGSFSGSHVGSFSGNGSGLTNIPAASVVGLNLSQISNNSATASLSTTQFNINVPTVITGSLTLNNGIYDSVTHLNVVTTRTIYSISQSLCDGAFFDYVIKDGANMRAGTIMAAWSGSSVTYAETTTTDLGLTSPLVMSVTVSGSVANLVATPATGDWKVKAIIRAI